MPLPELPKVKMGATTEETLKNVMNAFNELRDIMEAFMPYIGSENIPRLLTNKTQIMSDDGSTEIKGPLLLMFDLGKHIRRKEGLDKESGLFTDEWYNEAGDRTAYIDTDGKLVVEQGIFKGTIDIGAGNFIVDKDGNVIVKTNLHVGNVIYVGNNDEINKAIRLRTKNGADVILQGWTDIGPGLSVGYRGEEFPDTEPMTNLDFIALFATRLVFGGSFLEGNFDCSGAIFTELFNGVSYYATQAWAAEKGKSTGSNSHKHTVMVNGVSYETTEETHSHAQT